MNSLDFPAAIKAFGDFGLRVNTNFNYRPPKPASTLEESAWNQGYVNQFSKLSFPIRFLIACLQAKNRLLLTLKTAIELNDLLNVHPEWLIVKTLQSLFVRGRKADPLAWIRKELEDSGEEEVGEIGEDDEDFNNEFERDEEAKENDRGFFIRRAYVTPLRVCPLPPEWDAANRIIRNFVEYKDRFLRVTFVDENFASIFQANTDDVFKRVARIVNEGFQIAGEHFEYLAYSSSQLREASCWFYCQSPKKFRGETRIAPTAEEIRNSMGDLSGIRIVGKRSARLGQGFSTSRATATVLASELLMIPDVEREGYCFSDGVGLISEELAVEVNSFLVDNDEPDFRVPSAFQIRYAGCKGTVSVAPKEVLGSEFKLAIRKSMKKFDGNTSHNNLEVVGIGKPIRCYLNRQIIVILSSLGVPDSVFLTLLQDMLVNIDSALVENDSAIRLMDSNSVQSNTALLMLDAGVDVTKDRHLAHLVQAARTKLMVDLELKARMLVSQGISLIGIMDETESKVLPSGKIFLQYRDRINGDIIKLKPGTSVTVFRNPCLHPGDVRIMEIFDCEELSHLVDVVVFSARGDRPDPNKMSGGDLDGDIYTVIFDPKLIPRHQYDPMEYRAPPAPYDDGSEINTTSMKEFFLRYIRNDNLGRIANAHLVHADMNGSGVISSACLRLAELHSTAVDFNKTGVPAVFPRDLNVHKYPDFMGKPPAQSYKSDKVLGKIYQTCVRLGDKKVNSEPSLVLDLDFEVEGYFEYVEDALEQLDEFSLELLRLMERYDITDEGEAVSGYCTQFSRKKSKVRGDDAQSRFSHQVKLLQKKYYRIFLEDLDIDPDVKVRDWAEYEEEDQRNILRKASAWYYVTYNQEDTKRKSENNGIGYPPFLSFCWIVARFLCAIKKMTMKAARDRSREEKDSTLLNLFVS